jgi:N-acetylmuramoyl-L-alanine amidase
MFARTAALVATSSLALAGPASAHVHTVLPGETLSGIAAANGLPASAVVAANGLAPTALVVAGANVTVPASAAAAPAVAGPAPSAAASPVTPGAYRVQPGDSLSTVAARNGLSAAALAAANGLSSTSWLFQGRTIRLTGAPVSASAASTPTAAPEVMGAYTVRPGDTLGALAARSRVPMAQMAYVNGVDPAKPLLVGTVLKLPTGAPVRAAAPAPAPAVVPAAPPTPTATRLSAGAVGSIAAQHGVPSSLASAIAYQESGFNNAMVSSANARGIMQVLPGTWDWVQANLARGRLNPASATDNVRAGSLYLAQLLRDTGGDAATAAASYYQGLASVRRIGMLPETRRYVANVMALRSRFGG